MYIFDNLIVSHLSIKMLLERLGREEREREREIERERERPFAKVPLTTT